MSFAKSLMIIGLVLLSSAAFAGGESEPKAAVPPEMSIHEAVLMGDVGAVKQHIAAGTDIDAKDQYGSTPLIVATTFGATEAAKVLIDAGADLSMANDEGSSPLHIAAFFCRTRIVEALLDAGADVNATNLAGRTALDSVSAPFSAVQPIYEGFAESMAPLGLRLDLDRIEKTRPEIASLLSS